MAVAGRHAEVKAVAHPPAAPAAPAGVVPSTHNFSLTSYVDVNLVESFSHSKLKIPIDFHLRISFPIRPDAQAAPLPEICFGF